MSDSAGEGVPDNPMVGIIANPASGQDIRRVVGHGVTVSNQQKVIIVRCVLSALYASGVRQVGIMPDPYGIGSRALQGLRRQPELLAGVTLLDMPMDGSAEDSLVAARLLSQAAGCIVALGGDGTTRVVAKGSGEVPLLPISTGTNNVIPYFVDGTVAGLAAAYVAQHPQLPREAVCTRYKRMEVWVNGRLRDQALVDVGVVAGQFVGARAVWAPDALRQVFVAVARPGNVGLSSIVGMLEPLGVDAPGGLVATLGTAGPTVLAPIAPGIVVPVAVARLEQMAFGSPAAVSQTGPAVLALDGEREIALSAADHAEVVVRADGPWIVDLRRTLERAAGGVVVGAVSG